MKLQADVAFKAGVVILVTLVSAYLIGLSYSYWWDELLSVSQAQLGVSEMFTKTILIDVHPPLYPFLLKIWVALFGISEIATRSLSFIFALGALLVFQHNLTQLTHNALERGLSVLFFVCAWPFLFYGNEVRSYSLLLFMSTLCYFRVYRQQSNVVTYLLLVLLALTHYFGLIFTLFCLLILFLGEKTPKGKLSSVLCGAVMGVWPVVHAIGGSLAGKTGGSFWIEADPFDAFSKLVDLYLTLTINGKFVSAASFSLLVLLAVLTYRKNEKALAITIASVWLGLLALSLIDLHSPMTTTRNLICLLPVCSHVLVVATLRVFGSKIALVLVGVLCAVVLNTKDKLEQKILPLQANKELFQKLEPIHTPLYYYFPTQAPEFEWWIQKLFEVYAAGKTLPRFGGCASLTAPAYIVQLYKKSQPPFEDCVYEEVYSSDGKTRLLKASPVTH